MASTREVVAQLLDTVKAAKEQAVRDKHPMAAAVLWWRGGERVAVAFPAAHRRDLVLDFARIGAIGFAADLVAVCMDSYSALVMDNPMTGEPWGQGEMMEAVEKHHGRERGWITDALSISAANRAGDQFLVLQHYDVKFRRVTWAADPVIASSLDEENPKVSGVVPQALAEMMVKLPSLDQIGAQHGLTATTFGHSPEAGRAAMDCATVKVFGEQQLPGAVMLYAEQDSERAAFIHRSMGDRIVEF